MILKRSRPLVLQLTPLLDLLLIVIFAQFMDVRQTSIQELKQHQSEKQASQTRIIVLEDSLKKQNLLQEQQLATANQNFITLENQWKKQSRLLTEAIENSNEELKLTHAQNESLARLVQKLFHVPAKKLSHALTPHKKGNHLTKEQLETLQAQIQNMGTERVDLLVKHLLTYDEVIKRCDIWDIYLDSENIIHLRVNEKKYTFRAETTGEFETRLFDLYKSFPESKSLVIILVAYGDSSARPKRAIVRGLPNVTKRMADNSQTQTRFEYAILGFRSQSNPNIKPDTKPMLPSSPPKIP